MKCACLLSSILFTLFTILGVAHAQTQGVIPEWGVRAALQDLDQQAERLLPLLQQVDPASWADQDAPEAYAAQWKALTDEIGYVQRAATELSADPENLAKSVEVFLRLLSVEEMMDSFLEGVGRYHNPAIAELIASILNESSGARAGFRNHLLELATLKEAELKISDRELQRCRAELIQR